MTLRDWKLANRYTAKQLGLIFGIHESKMKRMLLEGYCVKLQDAHNIVRVTKGEIDYADLLQGDC